MTGPHLTGTGVRVIVNGQPRTLPPGTTLDAVIAAVTSSRTGIAVAVGEVVVPRAEWGSKALHDGDEIEILTAVQGG